MTPEARTGPARPERPLATLAAAGTRFLATGAFCGYLPVAPGTWGTLAAVPLYLALSRLSPPAWTLALAAVAALAVPLAGRMEREAGRKDPGVVVIDEVAGFLVTMFLIAPSPGRVAAGFLLFRAFDILKPPPGRRLERWPGGWGIVADDLVAGLYAHLALRVILGLV
jgi:phosphatidylglycerophosphatase A